MRGLPSISRQSGAADLRVVPLVLLIAALLGSPGAEANAQLDRPQLFHFYRAESADGHITFFYPSFHLRDARVPRPPMAMLDRVKHLVLEADIVAAKAHPEAVRPYILGAEPIDLTKLFTPPEIAGIRARAACNGLGPMVERLRLSFIAMIVALPCPKPDGGSYEEAVELAAQERGLEVTGLESAEEEFAAMAALPDRLCVEEIKQVAGHLKEQDRFLERMIALYNAGDDAGLYHLMMGQRGMQAADRKLFIDKIVVERNHKMADRLADVLARGDSLVIIGALHFPGKDGLLALMKQRGIKVTALDIENGDLY
jgi:uncharacterized protein